MIRFTILAAALALGACETAEKQSAAAPPSAADTSARSPATVNPVPAGQPIPQTPPTLPEDPAKQDKSMPPGPVNPPGR
jgi:hypothetical protein